MHIEEAIRVLNGYEAMDVKPVPIDRYRPRIQHLYHSGIEGMDTLVKVGRTPIFLNSSQENGTVIAVRMDHLAVTQLPEQDALLTWYLANCVGLGMRLRGKVPSSRDFLAVGHFDKALEGVSGSIKWAMRRYQILGMTMSIAEDLYPPIEEFLNSPKLKDRGFDPSVVMALDKKGSVEIGSGLVVTTEGGAFLRDPEEDSVYVIKDTWKWNAV